MIIIVTIFKTTFMQYNDTWTFRNNAKKNLLLSQDFRFTVYQGYLIDSKLKFMAFNRI